MTAKIYPFPPLLEERRRARHLRAIYALGRVAFAADRMANALERFGDNAQRLRAALDAIKTPVGGWPTPSRKTPQ